MDSLICGMFQFRESIDESEVYDLTKTLYPFFAEEYFLPWPTENIEEQIQKSIEKLINNNLLIKIRDKLLRVEIIKLPIHG